LSGYPFATDVSVSLMGTERCFFCVSEVSDTIYSRFVCNWDRIYFCSIGQSILHLQLYKPYNLLIYKNKMVPVKGIEPSTFALQVRCSTN